MVETAISEMIDRAYLFKSLEEEAREKLKQAASRQRFENGATLIKEGDQTGDMYIIESGSVEVSTTLPGGEVTLAELGPGAVLGEVAAITGAPRTSTVVAKEDVRAIVFAERDVRAIAEAYSKFRALIERMIEGRARHTITLIPPAKLS